MDMHALLCASLCFWLSWHLHARPARVASWVPVLHPSCQRHCLAMHQGACAFCPHSPCAPATGCPNETKRQPGSTRAYCVPAALSAVVLSVSACVVVRPGNSATGASVRCGWRATVRSSRLLVPCSEQQPWTCMCAGGSAVVRRRNALGGRRVPGDEGARPVLFCGQGWCSWWRAVRRVMVASRAGHRRLRGGVMAGLRSLQLRGTHEGVSGVQVCACAAAKCGSAMQQGRHGTRARPQSLVRVGAGREVCVCLCVWVCVRRRGKWAVGRVKG